MIKLLALDASTTNIGYVIGYNKELTDIGMYQPQGNDVHDRIDDAFSWILKSYCSNINNII